MTLPDPNRTLSSTLETAADLLWGLEGITSVTVYPIGQGSGGISLSSVPRAALDAIARRTGAPLTASRSNDDDSTHYSVYGVYQGVPVLASLIVPDAAQVPA